MRVSRVGYLVILFLAVSTILGFAILAVDDVLWEYALLHALGLLSFAVLDVLIIGLVLFRQRLGFIVATLLGLIQLGAMTGNLVVGAQVGVLGFTQAELTDYLLGIGISKGMAEKYGFYKLSPYAIDILMLVQIPLLVSAILAYKGRQ